jgi:hypothetical protein
MPAVFISWHEAARYCNWLTSGNTANGAYAVSNNFVTAIDRASALGTYGTVYVLPTEDEWYKAAYFTGSGYSSYANGLDSPPVKGVGAMYSTNTVWSVGSGSPAEQNGTLNMMGNVWEWSESAADGTNNNVGAEALAFRGGAYNTSSGILSAANRGSDIPGNTYSNVGLRVVAIPEPGTMSLMSLSTLGLFFTRSLRRRKLLGKSLLPIGREHRCDYYCTPEEWESAQNETAAEPDMLSIVWELMRVKAQVTWSRTASAYKEFDRKFWDRMVVIHERRVAKRKAFKAAAKKKTLDGLDAFLALFMK